MMRSKSHRVGIDARIVDPNPIEVFYRLVIYICFFFNYLFKKKSKNANIPLPYYLNVVYRANVEDALRRIKVGVKMILTPSN